MEAAFFDLDKTIVARSALLAYGRSFYRAGLLSRRSIVLGAYAQVVFMLVGAGPERMERMRASLLTLVEGWDRDHVAGIVREAFDEVVAPIVYDEALDLLREHRDAGRLVVLISSSPEEVVLPLATHLGAHEAIATRAETDADGRYTGRLTFYAYGENKAKAMRDLAARRGVDLAASFAYSDSVTDVPMLEAVGHPVAVNPDRELARIARERGWEVRSFHRQVGLPSGPRRGRAVRVAPLLLAAAALAAVGAVAGTRARVWRRRRRDCTR